MLPSIPRSCIVLLSSLLLPFSGCSTKQISPSQTRYSSDAYEKMRRFLQSNTLVAPGNTVAVEHSGDNKLSGEYKVDFDGKIQMPYKISLKAAARTPGQLAESVQKAYQPFLKGAYPIRVEIRNRNVLVEIRGEVKNPGRYLVRLDMPLEELVSVAGGFSADQGNPSAPSSRSRPGFLRIERPFSEKDNGGAPERQSLWFPLEQYFHQYETEPDFLWRGGEKLFFQESAPADADIKRGWHTITVIGEVRDPKEHPVLPNADLLTYVSRSGGTTSAADLSRVEIVHRASDKRSTANLITDRVSNQLTAGDVIIVRAVDNTPGFFEKALSYALSISTLTLSIVAIIIL